MANKNRGPKIGNSARREKYPNGRQIEFLGGGKRPPPTPFNQIRRRSDENQNEPNGSNLQPSKRKKNREKKNQMGKIKIQNPEMGPSKMDQSRTSISELQKSGKRPQRPSTKGGAALTRGAGRGKRLNHRQTRRSPGAPARQRLGPRLPKYHP